MRDCTRRVRQVSSRVQVRECGVAGRQSCSAPCYNCPVACRQTERTVCRTEQRVGVRVGVAAGLRTTSQSLQPATSCTAHNETRLCAPINCEFVMLKPDCKGSLRYSDNTMHSDY